jgi:hypothetical protein
MKSLRASAQKAGLSPGLPVRNMAKRFKLPEPLSLLLLLEQLAPDQIVFDTGHVEAGDVSGSARFALLKTGWWSFKGSLRDNGDLFGDNYVFAAVLNHVDHSGHTVAVKQEGVLDGGDSKNFQIDGKESWITDNWDEIKSKGFTWKLHADTHASAKEVFDVVLVALGLGLAVAGTILFLAKASSGGCTWKTNDQGIQRCEY